MGKGGRLDSVLTGVASTGEGAVETRGEECTRRQTVTSPLLNSIPFKV